MSRASARHEDSCSLVCDGGFGGTPCDRYPGRHRARPEGVVSIKGIVLTGETADAIANALRRRARAAGRSVAEYLR